MQPAYNACKDSPNGHYRQIRIYLYSPTLLAERQQGSLLQLTVLPLSAFA